MNSQEYREKKERVEELRERCKELRNIKDGSLVEKDRKIVQCHRELADMLLEIAETDEEWAEYMGEVIATLFEKGDPEKRIEETMGRIRLLSEKAKKYMEKRRWERVAGAYFNIGALFLSAGMLDDARRAYETMASFSVHAGREILIKNAYFFLGAVSALHENYERDINNAYMTTEDEIECEIEMGLTHLKYWNIKEAFKSFYTAGEIAERNKMYGKAIRIYERTGYIEFYLGYEDIKGYEKAIKVAKKIGDYHALSELHLSYAEELEPRVNKEDAAMVDKVERHYRKAIKYMERAGNKEKYGEIMLEFGRFLLWTGRDWNEGLSYLQKAEEFAEKNMDYSLMGRVYLTLAQHIEDEEERMEYFYKSMDAFKKCDEPQREDDILFISARDVFGRGNAEKFADFVEKILEDGEISEHRLKYYPVLRDILWYGLEEIKNKNYSLAERMGDLFLRLTDMVGEYNGNKALETVKESMTDDDLPYLNMFMGMLRRNKESIQIEEHETEKEEERPFVFPPEKKESPAYWPLLPMSTDADILHSFLSAMFIHSINTWWPKSF